MKLKPYKILSYGVTRWSSLLIAVTRILDRWDALVQYFSENKVDDEVSEITKAMKKPENKVYLSFLKIGLRKINGLNEKFQRSLSQVCDIKSDIQEFYQTNINILLKWEAAELEFDKKLAMVQKVKELKFMKINDEYVKSREKLVNEFQFVYMKNLRSSRLKISRRRLRL